MNYHYLLLPIPFLFELYADWWLITKGKKDIHVMWRILMIAIVSITWLEFTTYGSWMQISWHGASIDFGRVALACVPFCFFDPALNKLRGLRWDYTGKTKNYDLKLSKINPVALLIGRFVLAAGLIVYWYNVTFGR